MEKLDMSKKLSFSVRISDDTRKYVHGDTIDELIEAIELLKDVKFIKKFVEEFPNLSTDQYDRLEHVVLNSNNIDEICKYAANVKVLINREKFEDAVIASSDNKKIIKFASNVIGANIEKLEDAVIASKDKNSILDFFFNVRNSNPEKIKKALLAGEKDATAIYDYFVRKKGRGYTIDMNEIKEIDDIIIASNDANICLLWAQKNIEGIDIPKLEDVVIQSKNTHYILLFAMNVKGANIEKLEDAYIEYENSAYNFADFATKVKGSNIEKLEDAVIKKGEASNIYFFAKVVEGANLYKLRKALKASKSKDKKTYIERWKKNFGMKGIFKSN